MNAFANKCQFLILVQTTTSTTRVSTIISALSSTAPSVSSSTPDPFPISSVRPTSEKLTLNVSQTCSLDDIVDAMAVKAASMNSEIINRVTTEVSTECHGMKDIVSQLKNLPDTKEVLDELILVEDALLDKLDIMDNTFAPDLSTIKADVLLNRKELGLAVGKAIDVAGSKNALITKLHEKLETLDSKVDTIGSELRDFDLIGECRQKLDDIDTKLDNVARDLSAFKNIKAIPGATAVDFQRILERLDTLLTQKDLENFFSLESCGRNRLACVPWLIAFPAIFGLLVGMVVSIRCACCCKRYRLKITGPNAEANLNGAGNANNVAGVANGDNMGPPAPADVAANI